MDIADAVVYEDDKIIVLNKPEGLACQGGVGVRRHVLSLLMEKYNNPPHLLHRLDEGTSGILLLARPGISKDELSRLYQGMEQAQKKYLLLVRGHFAKSRFTVTREDEVRRQGRITQKATATAYAVLKTFAQYTLLQATLITGRHHQIRRDMNSLEHPILGDRSYGDFTLNASLRRQGWRSLFLMARLVAFPNHPHLHASLRAKEFKLPPSDSFLKFFARYQLNITI